LCFFSLSFIHFPFFFRFHTVVFDKHDLDGNNAITKDEFHEFIYSMGRYMDEQELEAAWTFIELNGDGKIVGLICSLTLTPQLPVVTH